MSVWQRYEVLHGSIDGVLILRTPWLHAVLVFVRAAQLSDSALMYRVSSSQLMDGVPILPQ
jgi:hypothetical protein